MESSKEVSEKVNLEKRDIPCKAAPKEETKEVTVSAEKIQKTDLLGKTTEASIKVSTSYLCTNCTNLFPGVSRTMKGKKLKEFQNMVPRMDEVRSLITKLELSNLHWIFTQ